MECQYFFLRFFVLSVDDSLLIAGSIENILKNNQSLSNKVLRWALSMKQNLRFVLFRAGWLVKNPKFIAVVSAI